MSNRHRIVLLSAVIILATFLRFAWLNYLPHSISSDELHYAISAKSFYLTGKDATQKKSLADIFRFNYPPNETVQAELPYVLEMLTLGRYPFSLAGSVYPSAFFGVLLVVIMYFITKELTGNTTIALLSSLISAINPWLLLESRTSYEMITANFFYMLALYIILKTKRWYILLALPVLILAFYSYIATKVLLFPFVAVCLFYNYSRSRKTYNSKYAIAFIVLIFMFIEFFIIQQSMNSHTSRLSEVITPRVIAQYVTEEKSMSLFYPFTFLFINPLTIFIKLIAASTFDIFSPQFLFLSADTFMAFQHHGIFYLVDAVFLVIGGIWLYNYKKSLLLYLLALIGVSILPQVVRDQKGTFSPHITLLVPFMVIIISVGMWVVAKYAEKKRYRFLPVLCALLYMFSFGNLVHMYLSQFPLSDYPFTFSDRILSRYIQLAGTRKQKFIIYTQDPELRFKEYIFYSNSYTQANVTPIANAINQKKYALHNVVFSSCNEVPKTTMENSTQIVRRECNLIKDTQRKISFINPFGDTTAIYTLLNDPLCQQRIGRKSIPISLQDFAVENLSTDIFCKKFFNR